MASGRERKCKEEEGEMKKEGEKHKEKSWAREHDHASRHRAKSLDLVLRCAPCGMQRAKLREGHRRVSWQGYPMPNLWTCFNFFFFHLMSP